MKKVLLIALLTLINGAFSAPIKIGYINIDHVLTSSPQFIDASKRVAKEFKPKEAVLVELSKKIKNLVNALKKDEVSLSKTDIKTRINNISKLEIRFKQQAAKLQSQFDEKNQDELNKIQDLMNKIIQKVAKEKNFDLILYQEVAYIDQKLNISKIISNKLRAAFK